MRTNILFGNERRVVRNIAAQMTRENPGLDKRQLTNAKPLIEQGVGECFLLALLIGLMTRLRPVSVIRPRRPCSRKCRADLLTVDQCDGQAIGQPGPEFFHQIERQRGAIRSVRMEEADEWIEPDTGQRGDAIVPHQRVEK